MLGDENSIPTEIPLDEDATTLAAFFRLSSSAYWVRKDAICTLTAKTANKVLRTCDKYDGGVARSSLVAFAEWLPFTFQDAKSAFIFGCNVRSEYVCRKALELMDYSHYPDMGQEFLNEISKKDLHAFHHAVWKSESRRTFPRKPRQIARNFSCPD